MDQLKSEPLAIVDFQSSTCTREATLLPSGNGQVVVNSQPALRANEELALWLEYETDLRALRQRGKMQR